MQPFEPNKQQLETLSNGATMLWIPIIGTIHKHENTITFNWNDITDTGSNLLYESEYIKQTSPLQLGKQYFTQEKWRTELEINLSSTLIRISEDLLYPGHWQPANQMQEHQSRIKFTVTNVKVEQVSYLNGRDKTLYNMGCYASSFSEWYDNQYPNQPYNTNPYGFLVTIKKGLNNE